MSSSFPVWTATATNNGKRERDAADQSRLAQFTNLLIRNRVCVNHGDHCLSPANNVILAHWLTVSPLDRAISSHLV